MPVIDGPYPATIDDSYYRLDQFLTEQFASIEVWGDLADVLSAVFFDNIESNRLALGNIRDPLSISRYFKILYAKMLGFNHPSGLITDAGYDRINIFLAAYDSYKGTQWFIKFIGFIRDFNLDLITLWTQDYVDFFPGIPLFQKSLIQDPILGTWYPTTTVGITYDQFGPTVPNQADLVDITALFYEMAPITLVLQWIAAAIWIYAPPIVFGAAVVEECELELINNPANFLEVWFAAQLADEEEIEVCNAPVYAITGNTPKLPVLVQEFNNTLVVDSLEDSNSWQSFSVTFPAYWDLATPGVPPLWSFSRPSFANSWQQDGSTIQLLSNIPRVQEYDQNGAGLRGWLVEPSTTNYLSSSFNPTQSWLLQNITAAPVGSGPGPIDHSHQTFSLNKSLTGSGYLSQSLSNTTTIVYTAWSILKKITARYAAIIINLNATATKIGVVADLQAFTVTPINPTQIVNSGMLLLENGYCQPWFSFAPGIVISGIEYRVYPIYNTTGTTTEDTTALGITEIYTSQVEANPFPTSPILTTFTTGVRAPEIISVPEALPFFSEAGFNFFKYYSKDILDYNHTLVNIWNSANTVNILLQIIAGRLTLSLFNSPSSLVLTSPTILTANTVHRVAWSWSFFTNIVQVYQDGVNLFGNNFFALGNNFENCIVGIDQNSNNSCFGYLQKIFFSNIFMTPSQLQVLTTLL